MASVAAIDLLKVHGKERKTVQCVFYPQATSDPTVSAWQSRGVASVTRTAQGTFLITLSHAYKRLVSYKAAVQHTTVANLIPQFGDISNVGTNTPVTVVVRLVAVATATDMAANDNNSVSVELTFSDSSAY